MPFVLYGVSHSEETRVECILEEGIEENVWT